MEYVTDTIAAVSTAVGGGIAIVRLSGGEAVKIAERIFKPFGKCSFQSHRVYYGHIADEDKIIDEVMLTVMKGPKSYTREDVVEINSHGGIKSVELILSLVLAKGARLAEPGEFTKRAFLNGRIDLVNAQAVVDVINSKTEMSHNQAMHRLGGKLSMEIKEIRESLLNMLALIEVSIDYPEHEMEEENISNIGNQLEGIRESINRLIKTGNTGMAISQGIGVVILGKPNVGKSSLLNKILMAERAIVTDIPGTTRDILQENASIKGIPVKIIDTAGVRKTEDIVEKQGVEKTIEYAKDADLILFMVDGSNPLDDKDLSILEEVGGKQIILVVNKADLPQKADISSFKENSRIYGSVEISAKNNIGLENLYDTIYNMFVDDKISVENTALISNAGDMASLKKALEHINMASEAINMGMTEDIIAIDLNEAYANLGRIIGETVEDDVIDRVFSQFCLGK